MQASGHKFSERPHLFLHRAYLIHLKLSYGKCSAFCDPKPRAQVQLYCRYVVTVMNCRRLVSKPILETVEHFSLTTRKLLRIPNSLARNPTEHISRYRSSNVARDFP